MATKVTGRQHRLNCLAQAMSDTILLDSWCEAERLSNDPMWTVALRREIEHRMNPTTGGSV